MPHIILPRLALFAGTCALVACRSNYDEVGLPGPVVRDGVRVAVQGVERGAFGGFRAVHGEAVNTSGSALRSCRLVFAGIDFSGEKIGTATAERADWPAGETWKFRAAFQLGGEQELYDVQLDSVAVEPAAPR